jgi:hypothetical protein
MSNPIVSDAEPAPAPSGTEEARQELPRLEAEVTFCTSEHNELKL